MRHAFGIYYEKDEVVIDKEKVVGWHSKTYYYQNIEKKSYTSKHMYKKKRQGIKWNRQIEWKRIISYIKTDFKYSDLAKIYYTTFKSKNSYK